MPIKKIDLGNGYAYIKDKFPVGNLRDGDLFISLKQARLTGKILIYRKLTQIGKTVKCRDIGETGGNPTDYGIHESALVNQVVKTVSKTKEKVFADTDTFVNTEDMVFQQEYMYAPIPTMEDYEKLLKRIEKLEAELAIAKTLPLWRTKYED